MSKRLKTKYTDFINESLYLSMNLSTIIVELPRSPISSLLIFLNDSESYPDESIVNYISLNDALNMLKYPPVNRRTKTDDFTDNFGVPSQTEMRIGRAVKSIIRGIDKSKLSAEYNGSVTFTRYPSINKSLPSNKDITFSSKTNGLEFSKFFNDNCDIFSVKSYNVAGVQTFVKIFKDDKQIIGSDMISYWDETYRIEWDKETSVPYFRFRLEDGNIDISGVSDVRINLEIKFSGKYINDINDSDIEKFVNDVTAFIKMNMSPEGALIEEVKGEEIRKWYNLDNYQSKAGQLGGSCMSYSNCQGYMDIYTENPEQISLLLLKNTEGKLVGRALLCKLDDSVSGGNRFMDRIYCHTDYDVKIFEKWAIDNNCIYRNSGNNNNIDYFFDGKSIGRDSLRPKLYVTIHNCDFDEYPYLDTMCYLSREDSILSNINQHDMELRDTEGKWTEYYDSDNDNY